MTTTRTKLPKSHFSKMGHIRWRNKRIKLVVTITPNSAGQKWAKCIFEGNTYQAIGKTHSDALEKLFSVIYKKAKLDVELNAENKA